MPWSVYKPTLNITRLYYKNTIGTKNVNYDIPT